MLTRLNLMPSMRAGAIVACVLNSLTLITFQVPMITIPGTSPVPTVDQAIHF